MRTLDVPESPGQHGDRKSLRDDVEDVVRAGRQGEWEIFQWRLAGLRTERNRGGFSLNTENTLSAGTNITNRNGVPTLTLSLTTNWETARYDFHFSLLFIICNFLPPVNILLNADLQTIAAL